MFVCTHIYIRSNSCFSLSLSRNYLIKHPWPSSCSLLSNPCDVSSFLFQDGCGSGEQEGRARGPSRRHPAMERQQAGPFRALRAERGEYKHTHIMHTHLSLSLSWLYMQYSKCMYIYTHVSVCTEIYMHIDREIGRANAVYIHCQRRRFNYASRARCAATTSTRRCASFKARNSKRLSWISRENTPAPAEDAHVCNVRIRAAYILPAVYCCTLLYTHNVLFRH